MALMRLLSETKEAAESSQPMAGEARAVTGIINTL